MSAPLQISSISQVKDPASRETFNTLIKVWNSSVITGAPFVTSVTGSGNIASSGGTTPNITFTGTLPVANGGTGVATSGTTAQIAVGGGTSSPIVWTTATGTGAPVRAGSPTFTGTPVMGALSLSNNQDAVTAATISNTNAGSSARTRLNLTNDTGTALIQLISSGHGSLPNVLYISNPIATTGHITLNVAGGEGLRVAADKAVSIPGTLGVTGLITGTTIKLTTGANNGYVLTSDANGLASWQNVVSGMTYKGTWDASTNTPTLADGTGTTGDTYAVTVGANRDLGSGTQTFVTGGWCLYNGTIWNAVGTSAAVTSVNSLTGAVSLVLASSAFVNQGTTTTVLHGNAAGNPSWAAVSLTADVSGILPVANGGTALSTIANAAILVTNSANTLTALTAGASQSIRRNSGNTAWEAFSPTSGTVTSVAQSFTGGLISVAGSPITSSGTLALTVAGNSGGIPYFNSATSWASSAALAANGIVIGGGAGTAPYTDSDLTFNPSTGIISATTQLAGQTGLLIQNLLADESAVAAFTVQSESGYIEFNQESSTGIAQGRSNLKSTATGGMRIYTNGATSLSLGTGSDTSLLVISGTGDISMSGLTASKPIFTDGSKVLTSSGIVPVANGGTGSATQNWVDLSTTQTGIAGAKTWTGVQTVTAGANTGDAPTWMTGLHAGWGTAGGYTASGPTNTRIGILSDGTRDAGASSGANWINPGLFVVRSTDTTGGALYWSLGSVAYQNSTVVTAGSFTTGVAYEIVTVGTTDFTAIGAASNTVGVAFVATGAGSGTGTATPDAHSTYAMYLETWKASTAASTGIAQGIELSVNNRYDGTLSSHPYNTNSGGLVEGQRIYAQALGAGTAYAASHALMIGGESSGATFQTGLIFNQYAAAGTNRAISMAEDHTINWHTSAGGVTPVLTVGNASGLFTISTGGFYMGAAAGEAYILNRLSVATLNFNNPGQGDGGQSFLGFIPIQLQGTTRYLMAYQL